jgi:hypothetical protein
MPQVCRVCASPKRSQIDLELAGGHAQRAVALRAGLAPSSVRRHALRHLSPALTRVAAQRRAGESAEGAYVSVLTRLEALADRVDRFLQLAEAKGAIVGGAAVLREMRQLLETIAKITGELDERPTVTVNLLSSPEIVELLRRISDALTPFPDARIALAEVLDVDEVAS